jgi:hypothetical protein
MKKLLTTTLLFFFIGWSLQLSAQRTIGKNATISGSTTTVSNTSSFSWVGEFEYSDDASNTHYELVVEDEGGQHVAVIDIQGNAQLDLDGRIRCKVVAAANHIEFYYVSHTPIHSDPNHAPAAGALLFKLLHNDGELYTKWNDLRPANFDAATNGEIFFQKAN